MLKSLDHVNIRTQQLAELRRFYCNVLGLAEGPRPNFSFGGAWLYCQGKPVVHLVEVATDEQIASPTPNDAVQHFAFAGEDLAPFLERLRAHQVPFRVGKLYDFELCQVNIRDPDGNPMHIDFPLHEAEALSV